MRGLDFSGLNSRLMLEIRTLVPQWLPGGKMMGSEYCCGDLSGKPGSSLRVNMDTGKWADFAAGESGGDLIALYAAINNIDQKSAYEKLCEYTSHTPGTQKQKPNKDHGQDLKFAPPPKGTPLPKQLDDATTVWRWTSEDGHVLFLTARFDKNGKKWFSPWSWSTSNGWVSKLWPAPRPLYGLHFLKQHPKKPILVVEGEKSACAARKFAGEHYNIVTWSSGSKAYPKTDWSPVYGKDILIWPDADQPGAEAAQGIAKILHGKAKSIKIIELDHNDGWDAADSGFDWDSFVEWARPLAKVYVPEPDPSPKQPDEPPMPTEADMGPSQAQLNQAVMDIAEDKVPPKVDGAHYAKWQSMGLSMNGTKTAPQYNVDNTLTVLEEYPHLKNLMWYDEFHQRIMTYWMCGDDDPPREWADEDDVRLMRYLQRELGMGKTTKQMVMDAVKLYSRDNSRNEPKEWMNSLKWDGVHRIHSFFPNYMGCVDSDYSQAVSKNFWISMAARIMSPGCKMDNMVILEGKQGAFKSTALKVIGGAWFTEANEHPSSKDFYQILQGALVIEIAEMDSFNKAETETIKRVVSTPSDRFRPPYGKTPQTFPRQCVFVGTTNDKHYLKDVTGARRFWPLTVTDIDLARIKQDREQLFAEAVHRYKEGEAWHKVPKSALDEQEKRRQYDVWEEPVLNYISGKEYAIIEDICTSGECLGMPLERVNRQVQNRVANILRVLGWENGGTRRVLGRVRRVYEPIAPEQTRMPIPQAEEPPRPKPFNYAPGAEN